MTIGKKSVTIAAIFASFTLLNVSLPAAGRDDSGTKHTVPIRFNARAGQKNIDRE